MLIRRAFNQTMRRPPEVHCCEKPHSVRMVWLY